MNELCAPVYHKGVQSCIIISFFRIKLNAKVLLILREKRDFVILSKI